ncbi:MAG: DUF4433 domain-containing protein [Campylobacterota bacterium]|nr:DUF4433 domain-containing protein [Campylobacterota bacterium]
MEWIIGIFILWLIGLLSGDSSTSTEKSSSTQRKDTDKSIEDLLSELDLPDDRVTSPTKLKEESNKNKPLNEYFNDSIEEDFNPIVLSFENKGVNSLWHMTHRDNVVNILRHGILSNTQAINSADPVDISDHGVQRWREAKDPIYGRKIHDYTPTYFNIRNPMLYVRKNIQNELCLIEISLSVLSKKNFLFTDGNAAAINTNFYNSLDDLIHLPWEVLNASYWNDFEDGKRKRCAEVLIYPSIKQLLRICNNATKTRELFF